MKLTMNKWLRAGRWMGVFLIVLVLSGVVNGQTVSTTTVQGTVYLANGQPGAGTLLVSWPAFTTANNLAVAAGNLTVPIGVDGFVSVNLAPNLGATPAGLFYTAVYQMSDGTVSTEYWVVPAAASAALSTVQAQVMPAAQAVQAVTKAYVDEQISELEGSQLTQSGGTLTGPLYLNGDPTTALQAADKHYVDNTFSQAVPLSGGTMTGTLQTPGVNGVDSPVAGGTQSTLQQTITAAGTNGAVLIPPNYTGTDTFTNPNGVYVEDLRQGGAQQFERSVKEFGAVCDGVTDDTSALQAAINYAHTHNVALSIPQGTCKTQTLNWHGESIGGISKQVSALKGFPGQDVFATTPDSSIMPYTRLHDLTIYVDQSVDVSCSPAAGRNTAGSCVVNRPLETNSIFSAGGNALTGTAGTGTAWAVGNCAIAMPAATGATNGLSTAVIENIEIVATGTDPMSTYSGAHSTHTCGLYFAQWPEWSEFRNIDIHGLNTGIAIGAPTGGVPTGVPADSNRWQNITIQATHGFTTVAGTNDILDNVVVNASNSAATGEPPTGLVLDFARAENGWTVRNINVTPNWYDVQPKLTVVASSGAVTSVTVGPEHGLGFDPYGLHLPVSFSGSCTASATANVNTDGSIGSVTINVGGVGCSGTTTASVNVAGTWDTSAVVNLIAGTDMSVFGGNLLNGNGGYTVWNASGSNLNGSQLSGGGVLATGGSYPALLINDGLGTLSGNSYSDGANKFFQLGVGGGFKDNGLGNSIIQSNGTGEGLAGLEATRVPSNTVSADFALMGGGATNQAFTSLNDLFLSADDLLWPAGESGGTGSQYGKDASAPVTGSYVKALNGAWNTSGAWHVRGVTNAFVLGSGFPAGTGTWYVAAKADIATNQELKLTGITSSSVVCTFADKTVSLTTSWQVFSIPYNTVTGNPTCDSGTQGNPVVTQGLTPSTYTNVETAWMSFVPAFQSILLAQNPTQSNQVANKAYVDAAVSGQIISGSGVFPITGGTLTGPINAPVDDGTTDCALSPSVSSCIASAQSALIPPGTSGSYTQYASYPATASCVYDTTQGGKITQILPGALGYGYLSSPTISISGGGGTGLALTANVVGGQVTSYTITNGGSGYTGCPTLAIAAPPAASTPIPVLDQRRGLTTYSADVRVDDFGCAGDGVTDDTMCINNAIAYATSNGANAGTITFSSGKKYYVVQVTGYMPTAADDGTAPPTGDTCVQSNAANGISGSVCVPIHPETPGQLGYAIKVPNGLTIAGNGATIISNFVASTTTFSFVPPDIAIFASDTSVVNFTVNDLNIQYAFIAFASPGYAGRWLFRNVVTSSVGVSILANVLQLSTLRDINFSSLAGIIIGGWWQCRSSSYNCVSAGDFADNVYIDNYTYSGYAPSTPSGGVVANQNALDTWFDNNFFHHGDNATRMTDDQYGSLGVDTDSYWRGIYGIGIAYYSRYGRASNSDLIYNYIDKVSMSYPVVITTPSNLIIDTMNGEDVGECVYTTYSAWGTPGLCPNPYDSLNHQLEAAILFQRPGAVLIRNVEAPGIDAEAVVGLSWRQSSASVLGALRSAVNVENSSIASRYVTNNIQQPTSRKINWPAGEATTSGAEDSGENCYWGIANYGAGIDYDPWCLRDDVTAYTGSTTNPRYFVFENEYSGHNLNGPVGVQMPGLRVRPGQISSSDSTLPVSDFTSQAFSIASGSVSGSSCTTISGVSVPGAALTDGVLYVQPPSVIAPLQLSGAISSANMMLLSICNPTTSSLNYPTGIYTAFLLDGAAPASVPSTSGGAPTSTPTLTTAVGDLVTAGSGGAPTQLPGNTAAQLAVLTETGTGTSANAPVWSTAPAFSGANVTALNAANISSGTVSILNGGTGATSAAQALTNLGAVSLNASSVDFTGRVTGVEVGGVYQVDQYGGADFGAKLSACIAYLSSSYGGVCDARGLSGALTMSSTLTITTPNTVVYLPCGTISSAYQIVVPAGTRNVALHGCSLRGASTASGSQGGTVINYSGALAAIQVGDPTYASDTMGFKLDNVAINVTGSAYSATTGFAAYRTQELHLESLYFLGNSNQTGVTIDGTGNYAGGSFIDVAFNGFQTAVNGIGHQISNPATTDWMNASMFLRVHIDCPTSGGSPISGTYGINLQQGDGNTFSGGDVEGCYTALHLGANAQNNTVVGLRNENSTNQIVADSGSSYNSWMTGGTLFTGALTDNGTRNSFLDTFHRSFNGLNGDWYGSQKDATVTNHYRLGIGSGNERGLLNRYQTDYGYRWTMGLSDATAGEQFYQILDELNSVYRISIGQYNNGSSSTNNQTVINAAGTGAVVLNGSNGAGTGGVVFGSGGATETTVATIDNSGNAIFDGTLQVSGPSTFVGSTTVKNQANAEIDETLWAGLSASQKESFIYKDYTGTSQWFLVKDTSNNWAVNSAISGIDSFKAYQSTNSGDTYVDANSGGAVRINYEANSGSGFDVYSGSSSPALIAAFTGTTSIKFPGLAASSGYNCVQIDSSGYITNTGTACGSGSSSPSFSALTTGTNTSATLTVGSGATITTSGSGVNNANQLNGGSVPASATLLATNSSAQPVSVATLPTSAEPAHTGDVTNTAGSLATTVKGINGTLLSGLATGLLKNTTSTGVPTIAVAGTDYVVPSGSITGNAVGFTGSLSGDVTGTQSATSVVKVNGASVPSSATVVGTNPSSQVVAASTTGSGNVVLATSPTLVTPTLGVASATSVTTTANSTLGGSANTFNNAAAAENDVVIQAGSGAAANDRVIWNNYAGTNEWKLGSDTSYAMRLNDTVTGIDRFINYQGGQTIINSAGSSSVAINNTSSSGTGGFIVYEGGSNNSIAAFTVGGTGNITSLGTLTEQGTGTSSFAGPVTHTVTGAASTSALLMNGTVYTGGTGTTTYPTFAIWPSGATAPTTWSTSGTGLGMNMASGFAGNFLDFHLNGGASLFNVTSSGGVTAASAIVSGGGTSSFVAANFTNGSATAVNVTGSGGGVTIGNATGGLAITNTASTGIGVTMKNTTAATSSACSSSAPINIDGTYWTGSASATNVMSFTSSCATGTNGAETLTIADSGSTGLFTVAHSGEVTATAFGGSGSATLAAGAASGTSPTIACEASHVCSGSNGTIDLTTGTSTTTGVLLTITAPGTAHTNLPDCEAHLILAASPYTDPLADAYKFTYTTSVWTLNVGTALTASTAYQVTYHCMGY